MENLGTGLQSMAFFNEISGVQEPLSIVSLPIVLLKNSCVNVPNSAVEFQYIFAEDLWHREKFPA